MARRRVPPILRQRMVWPKGRKPIGAEIPVILKELDERLGAVCEYYGVEPDGPGWDEAFEKAQNRFEGFELRGIAGQDANPGQAIKDLVLVYWVERSRAADGTVTEVVRRYADEWNVSPRALRTRYYKLTRPKTADDRRARKRMNDMAAIFVDLIQKHQQQ